MLTGAISIQDLSTAIAVHICSIYCRCFRSRSTLRFQYLDTKIWGKIVWEWHSREMFTFFTAGNGGAPITKTISRLQVSREMGSEYHSNFQRFHSAFDNKIPCSPYASRRCLLVERLTQNDWRKHPLAQLTMTTLALRPLLNVALSPE